MASTTPANAPPVGPRISSTSTSTPETRIKAITEVIHVDDAIVSTLAAAANAAPRSDFTTAIDSAIKDLQKAGKINDGVERRLSFANAVAAISHDNVSLMKALDSNPNVNSIRDFALSLGKESIEPLLGSPTPGADSTEKKQLANEISRNLFTTQPTAVVSRVVKEDPTLVADSTIRQYVATFLANQPDFDISKTSVLVAIAKPDAFNGIPAQYRQQVIDELKKIQRVQAIAPVPEAMPALAALKMESAHAVASVPEPVFLARTAALVEPAVAKEVHVNSVSANIRNEQMLMTLLGAVKGTGLRAVDGDTKPQDRIVKIQAAAHNQGLDLNLENLFGTMDQCVCDDCTTVYSASSYFVELLNFLRNNNLDPTKTNTPGSIVGTPLEKLFRRRPDLGNLQLTCENTNTVLPYIDLANEVMESFILSLPSYKSDPNNPKQTTIDTWNSTPDVLTTELISQPQNTQYDAYRILSETIYPATTLPYHQPLDAIRTFLSSPGVAVQRWELLDAFRPGKEAVEPEELQELQKEVLDRSVEAEYLGFSQEEYIILTKEAFWSKHYFETLGTGNGGTPGPLTDKEYQDKIGVKPVYAHYGYASEAEMLDQDDVMRKGLMWVKAQFLPRTQIAYTTLVEFVQSKWMNPMWPEGKSREILDSLRFSYKFLQTFVDPGPTGSRRRFARLVKFLVEGELIGRLTDIFNADQVPSNGYVDGKPNGYGGGGGGGKCHCDDDIEDWVCEHFEDIGKLVVIDIGEGPRLGIHGEIFASPMDVPNGVTRPPLPPTLPSGAIATLHQDGRITGADGNLFGEVNINSQVWVGNAADEKLITDQYKFYFFTIKGPTGISVAFISIAGVLAVLQGLTLVPATWILSPENGGGCNIENARLVHLNGTPLTVREWDRTHRFLRLWRKLGWTVTQTDTALIGLVPKPDEAAMANRSINGTANGTVNSAIHGLTKAKARAKAVDGTDVTLDGFATPETDYGKKAHKGKASLAAQADIKPETLHQFVSIKELLILTQLSLEQLLTFWAPIPTTGDNSLYKQLFFNYNILPSDPAARKVFDADASGNYFASGEDKISQNLPVLMASLGMKADEIMDPQFASLDDKLDIDTISTLYRYNLLARVLAMSVKDVIQVINVFKDDSVSGKGNPFANPDNALSLIQTWNDMNNAGFTFKQLSYTFNGIDDIVSPLGPSQDSILETTTALYDGLKAIMAAHPDFNPNDPTLTADSQKVTAEAQLIYDQDTVVQIVELLEGTTVYVTDAPPTLDLTIPSPLSERLKYDNTDPTNVTVSAAGILTPSEIADAKALLDGDPGEPVKVLSKAQKAKLDQDKAGWAAAIDRLLKQTKNFYRDTLAGIFDDKGEVILLAGDIPEPLPKKPQAVVNGVNGITNGIAPTAPAPDTPTDGQPPSAKRACFLQYFIPVLRGQLERQFVLDTMASVAGISDPALTEVLLGEVLFFPAGNPPVSTSALDLLMSLKDEAAITAKDFTGYLRPPTKDNYTIFATSDTGRPPAILIDGFPHTFPNQSEDPSNLYFTEPVPLDAGMLYQLDLQGIDPGTMSWRTTRSPRSPIPASSLLPDYTEKQTASVFQGLYRAAIIVNGFKLTANEVDYLNNNIVDFGGAKDENFAIIQLKQWKRLLAYSTLRDSLPPSATPLISLFGWCVANPDNRNDLPDHLVASTGWDKANIIVSLKGANFTNGVPKDFKNEINLVKLQKLLKVGDKIRADLAAIFDWARPLPISQSWEYLKSSLAIQKSLRSRYDTGTWVKVVQPLNDTLRENQKNALISYLLVQDVLVAEGVIDADSLFEFFLIDVQMTPLVQTSRIKQAISTVQVFVQRCLLGQEAEKSGVNASDLDQKRWDWMQKYRVWEADRKVFLYPENWIDPSLRDDKTTFFQELESELLQKDINTDMVTAALENYVYKLDQVANLKVLALYNDDKGQKIYIFARTHAAPYSYYWRYYDNNTQNWYPWLEMQIEIPDYTSDTQNVPDQNWAYMAPVVWQDRLLVFLPQLMKKTTPPAVVANTATPVPAQATFGGQSTESISSLNATDTWEIRMAWTEYRGGKWSPRQLSPISIFDSQLFSIESYAFVPITTDAPVSSLSIGVYRPGKPANGAFTFAAVGAFNFNGGQLIMGIGPPITLSDPKTPFEIDFGVAIISTTVAGGGSIQAKNVSSLQAATTKTGTNLSFYDSIPEVEYPDSHKPDVNISYRSSQTKDSFYNKFAPDILSALLSTGDVQTIYKYKYLNGISDTDFNEVFGGLVTTTKAVDTSTVFNELNKPYSLYNWELGLHAPMLLVDRLLKSQKFDDALKVCHYIFNPLGTNVAKDPKNVWVFPPFQKQATQTLEEMFMAFAPDATVPAVNEWRDNPFQPHVIARSRPVAYMKWIAMKYIEILIAYGDYYFMQNTLETIPLAIQMYVMASHLYGPRGQVIPRMQPTKPQTYNSLLSKWDAFGNAMVDLELAFPFSNQTILPVGITTQGDVQMANIFGFATTLYFAIPDNDNLRALGASIDDRLFKIRHSQDINGIFRQLPLFEPPIDPGLLVQAAAKGLQLSTVLRDLNGPLPNYRFLWLLQKAFDVCQEVKALGGAFLTAKEKGDNEAYSVLRQKQDTIIQGLLMDVKKLQLDDATKSLEALQYSRKSPVYRLQHYLKLIGADPSAVPHVDAEFQELADQIEQPVADSNLQLSPYEKEEMDKGSMAQDFNTAIGAVETLAGVFLALPETAAHATPLGVGAAVKWGPPNLGHATTAVARALRIGADVITYQSVNAGRKGANQRSLQDRIREANSAGYEIKSIDKQVLSAQIKIDITSREIANQQKTIDQSNEVLDFLTTKYSSTELYSWMESNTRSLYYQTYTLAYDLAKKAENAYKFERPLEANNVFIQPGYWDASRDGLLAGEQLFLGLKQLEAAYCEKRAYDYEITKHVSLRQLNPLELMRLRETGTCEFDIREILFDMDFPGHYMRRIRTVSITMPCIVGPYTSINATLRLKSSMYRVKPTAANATNYLKADPQADNSPFMTANVPITAIAMSSGQNDSGTFELDFKDERYIPFEGAGAISSWKLDLPAGFRQFDYETLADVIVHIKYTSVDGGDNFRGVVGQAVDSWVKNVASTSQEDGLWNVFDIKNEFATEWAKAVSRAGSSGGGSGSTTGDTTPRTIALSGLDRRLPVFTVGKLVQAVDLYLLSDAKLNLATLKITEKKADGMAGKVIQFSDGEQIGKFLGYAAMGQTGLGMVDWEVSIDGKDVQALGRLWLLVRFTLN